MAGGELAVAARHTTTAAANTRMKIKSEPTFLPGARDRKQRAEHFAQAIIGTINALAVLGVEQKLSPERLTNLAMQLLWPGIDAMLQSDVE